MEQILMNVISNLTNEFSQGQLERIRVAMVTELEKYDFTLKQTELVTYENTNQQYLDGFLAWKIMEGKSKNTVKSYNFLLTKTFNTIQKSIFEITEYDLFLFLARIQKDGASKSYAENYRRALSSFFLWLKNKGFNAINPVEGIEAIKQDKLIKLPFTDEEMEVIRNNCETLREKAIIKVLYSCGVRVSELCSINKRDIDFHSKEFIVFGKGAKERKVYMNEKCVYALKRYLKSREDDDEALFVISKAPYSRVQPQAVRKLLKVIEERSGVKNIHPHRFRRTLATNLLKKGMPLEEVARVLGHNQVETTKGYCTLSDEQIKNSYNILMSA